MNDLISRKALCDYALNQKDKSVTPNDIMRFPSAQPKDSTDIDNALTLLNAIHSSGRMEYYSDYCALHDAISQISVQPDIDKQELTRMITAGIIATNTKDVYSCGMRNGMRWCRGLLEEDAPKFEDASLYAQPETHDKRTETHSCDLISRQAAIDALEWKWAGKAAIDAVKNLPSARLIQCKECVYGNKMKDTIRCELMDYLPVECDHFCSWAERIDNRVR